MSLLQWHRVQDIQMSNSNTPLQLTYEELYPGEEKWRRKVLNYTRIENIKTEKSYPIPPRLNSICWSQFPIPPD